jgi:hypothetical protein
MFGNQNQRVKQEHRGEKYGIIADAALQVLGTILEAAILN